MVPLATSTVVPLLYLAELKLGNLLRRQLSPLRITPLQYIGMSIIASRGTTAQEGLIEQMGVSASDLIGSIIPICDRGLLGREVVAGGVVTFCLTDLGRGLLDAATRLASNAAIGKANLDEQDMEQLLKLLARVIGSPEIPCPACEPHKPILARTVREATENK
jgi:DNA-binding MarR family transcriptional regulator